MIKKKNHNLANDNQGIVLLITLMILTVMMISVLALSQVISNEVRSVRYSDSAIVAFYAAESGIEQTLYQLKRARSTNVFTNFINLDEDAGTVDYNGTQTFRVTQASTSEETFSAEGLTTSTFAYVDLVEPGADLSAISGQFNCYELDWTINSCFPSHASDRLEITHTSLEQGFASSNTYKRTAVCNCAFGSTSCQMVSGNDDIDQNKFYRFSFRPLDNNVTSITFRAYKAVSCPSGSSVIPGTATIKVTGDYKQSSHSITATLPIYSPISDNFSYVIFSEEEILKGF